MDYINSAEYFLTPKIAQTYKPWNFPCHLACPSMRYFCVRSDRDILEITMTQLKFHLWLSLTVLLLACIALIGNQTGHAVAVPDKVLEIERYGYEPMELVDLRIGTLSVKDRINPKFRDERSKVGLDHVSFTEADDWFARVSLTLRNTSEKPVYGLRAYLYFRPAGHPVLYSMMLMPSRLLRNDPLQPGAEIEMTVPERELNQALENMKNAGVDASRTGVTLSLDAVSFSEVLQWSRGGLLRPDPTIPGKWIPVSSPAGTKQN